MNNYEKIRESERGKIARVVRRNKRLIDLSVGGREPRGKAIDGLFNLVHESDFQDLDNRQYARSILSLWGFREKSRVRPVDDYDVGPLRN